MKRLRRFLSSYHPRYPRALVYMLQASEYHAGEYLDWFWRAPDFRRVEYRKHLKLTTKAKLLLIGVYLVATAWIAGWAWAFASTSDLSVPWLVVLALLVVAVSPVLLAYGLLAWHGILRLVLQLPQERRIIRNATAKIAAHPAIKIGIAGSYGKTSMREILLTVLQEGKRTAAVPHSYNTPLGISQFVNDLKGDEEVLIFELGEYYPGDVTKLCELTQPSFGIMTGVNEAHLAKFKSLDATTRTIFELADYLKDERVYANAENAHIAAHIERRGWRGYSAEGVDGWKLSEAKISLHGSTAQLTKGKTRIKLATRLLGRHNLGPLAAAAAMATELGLSPSQIEAGLKQTRAFDHRMQPTYRSDGVTLIDDQYNGNPDGARALIDFLAELKGHRRLYITPGFVEMGAASPQVHQDLGRYLAEKGIEVVGLVRTSVTPDIEAGLQAAGFKGQIYWFRDGLDAAAGVEPLLKHGDVVAFQNDWPDNYS